MWFWIIGIALIIALVIWLTIDRYSWESLLEGKWPQRFWNGKD